MKDVAGILANPPNNRAAPEHPILSVELQRLSVSGERERYTDEDLLLAEKYPWRNAECERHWLQ
ncbi:hypothetical protein [Calothrix sp. UHCC 0171]|uniref:hypothetical protein n=1 Tax=Calothrix sp. UHCC 0171 TaxID=3110245 RepID=UPI002B213769|nr:hypothetical protein [Calothrix sp. UHCC 0171]MEA5574440.1 hypothetical protein [Calothrix sp. UHCC 0171]